MIILDTNVLSALMRKEDRAVPQVWLDRQPSSSIWTTSVTLYEIRFGIVRLAPGRRRNGMMDAAASVMEALGNRIAFFDELAAEAAAHIMVRRRAAGRTIDVRDTFIAGIAQSRRATLATRNVRHFAGLDLRVVDPWAE